MLSPDYYADGILAAPPNPLRYDGHSIDFDEATGMLAQAIDLHATVLDVGCGTGSISRIFMETREAQLTGIEPDPQRVAAARARGINVIEGYFDSSSIETLSSFDTVVFADVLEHLPDPASALQLAGRVLKPGGVVIASIPNVAHWSVRLELMRGRFDYQASGIMDATHLRWFTEKGVRFLFESSGYQIESIRHTLGHFLPAYRENFFWRNFRPRRYQRPLLRGLVKIFPNLFGCQHIVRARLKANSR